MKIEGNSILLINRLRELPIETEWVEFKHNNYDPAMIGADICALANSAALLGRTCSYMLWGIDDATHDVVGTKYNLQNLTKGKEEIGNWLRHQLSTNAEFEFHTVQFPLQDGIVDVGMLIIYKATNRPVSFDKVEYIRSGSYTKKLSDVPMLQVQLWRQIQNAHFEEQPAKQDLNPAQVNALLDLTPYYETTGTPFPSDLEGNLYYMDQEGIIVKQDNGLYAITNLGAILFARKLSDFPRIERKAIRVVQYKDVNRAEIQREDQGNKGYALGFEGLMSYIEALLPHQEVIEGAMRKAKSAYPLIAIRESVGNALIHQDFSVTGAGPVVEIFSDRIEITNPGLSLVDVNRIVDNPPKSRNEKLAKLMRRMRFCEELGSGWDRIIISCELVQLPAPKIVLFEDSTRVYLYSERSFTSLSPEERLWSCYMHACIKQVQGEQLTNKSLRERFGVEESQSASISRLIRLAVEEKLIKPLDPQTAPRYMRYIPIWA